MSKPIVLVWRGRPNRQYFELSETEQQKLWDAHTEAVKASGVQVIVNCRSDWSSERYSHFGVELYQDMESLMKLKDILFSVNWFSWIDGESVLGLVDTPIEPVAPGAGGIFKLVLMRPTQAFYALTAEAREAKFAQLDALAQQFGIKTIFLANSFSSERYLYVNMEHYPNLEALTEYNRCLAEMDWFQYADADIILGLQLEG